MEEISFQTKRRTKEFKLTDKELMERNNNTSKRRKGSDSTLDLDDDEEYYGSDDPRIYDTDNSTNDDDGGGGCCTTTSYDDDDDDGEEDGSPSHCSAGGRSMRKFNPNCPPVSLLPSKSKYEIAIVCCGEFWNPQRVFRRLHGVKNVIVGYTGGYSTCPSFDNVYDHTLALYIEYNPKKISYTTLLHVWHSHDYPWEKEPTSKTQSAIYCITSKQYQLAHEFEFNVLLPKAIQRRNRKRKQQQQRQQQHQQQQRLYYEHDDDILCRKQQCSGSTVVVDGSSGATQIQFDNTNDTTSTTSTSTGTTTTTTTTNPTTGSSTTSTSSTASTSTSTNNIELYVHIGYATTIFYQAELYQQDYISKQIQQAKQQLQLWMVQKVNSSLYTIYE